MAQKKAIQNVFQTRLDQLNDARAEALEKKGMKPFFTFPQGETTVDFALNVEPRLTTTGKNAYRGVIEEKEYDIPLAAGFERQILSNLVAKKAHIVVVRVGEGKTDTRYSIKSAE